MKKLQEQLVEAGHALTPARKDISKWIAKQKGIFSVLDILKSLPSLDKVTVYRTVQLLEDIDAIDPVVVRKGVQYYEVHSHKEHHHHIVCTECNFSECIPCDFDPKIKNFTSAHHTVAMTGVCNKCI